MPTEPLQQTPSLFALAPVRQVELTRPLHWLKLGWRDYTRAIGPSSLQGLLFVAGGFAVLAIGWGHFHLLSGAFSGFVLVAPVLATGFYEASRKLGRGETPHLSDALAAWRRGGTPLLWFGLVFMILGTFWVVVSMVMIALFVQAPIVGLEGFLRHVVLSQSSNLFEIWVALGGVGAALVFAATVVSAPMLLDRDVDMLSAVLTSIRAVGENPMPMVLWATLIMVLTGLGMATLLLGLVLVVPVVGHATWHAYREVVDASALPPRD